MVVVVCLVLFKDFLYYVCCFVRTDARRVAVVVAAGRVGHFHHHVTLHCDCGLMKD